MKIKSILASCIFVATTYGVQAQYYLPENNNWVMGTRTGLSFNNNSLNVLSTNISNANEGSASVSDALGNLLFYTNGTNIWNRLHQLMPNGSSINGSGAQTASTTQAASIVPHPGDPNLYYVFSLTATNNSRLFVNLVDMSQDSLKGNISMTFPLKNVVLKSQLTEKMTAVPACNNTVWLVTRSIAENAFLSYRINANGLDTVPVISRVGSFATENYGQGVLKANANGTQLLTANFKANQNSLGLEVFDFDGNTGMVTNPKIIDSINTYGATFSPDGSKVYAQQITSPGTVYQYDITKVNPLTSKTIIGHVGQYADMKIGPDSKIYIASHIQSPGFNAYRYFARINNPNAAGVACNFQDSVSTIRFLNANQSAGVLTQGLPNDIVKPLGFSSTVENTLLDTIICGLDTMEKYTLRVPDNISNFIWENNDTSRVRDITLPGVFYITYNNNCGTNIDSFKVQAGVIPNITLTHTMDEVICNTGFVSYQWYYNDILISQQANNRIPLRGNGKYKVSVTNEQGCISESEILINGLTHTNNVNINTINIYPNPARNVLFVKSDVAFSHIKIMNTNGHQISEYHTKNTSMVDFQIDTEKLVNGLYILNITLENGANINRKMVVNH